MAANIQLRNARPEDALCLSVLAMQVWLDTYATEGVSRAIAREITTAFTEYAFQKLLQRVDTRIVVAETNAALVGFAKIDLGVNQALAPSGIQAELEKLYVQERFTRQHIGTTLLDRAEIVAYSEGATVMWLTPWVRNLRALAFYKNRGYVDFGVTQFDLQGELHENRVYAKRLNANSTV